MATSKQDINVDINVQTKNAQNSSDSLKSKIRELQKEMQQLALAGKQNTEEYKRLANEAGRLTDIIGDVAQDTKNLANDNQKLAASIQGVGAGVAVFSSLQSVAAMLGVEDEKLLKTMQKIQAVQSLLNSLNTIANALNKNSALMTLLRTQRTAQLNKELEENTVVTEEATVTTNKYTEAEQGAAKGAKTLSTGIKGVGSAMKSVAVIAIISAAVAGLMKLIEKYNETREEQRKLYEEHQNAIADFEKKVNETASKTIAKYNVLSTAFSRLNGDIKEQQKFIQQHKTDFDELGMSINSVEDAENALIKNKEAFVEAQLAKAKAMAAQSTLEDLMKQRLELQKQREETNKLGETLQNIYSQYDNAGQVVDKTAKTFSNANDEIDAQIADIDKQAQQLIDDILNFTPTVTTTTTKAVKDTGDAIEKLKNEVLLAEKQMNVNATKEWSEERLKAEKELNEAQRQIASQALEEKLKDTELSEEEKNVLRLKLEEEYQLKEIALVEKYDEKKKENRAKEIQSSQNTIKARFDAEIAAIQENTPEYVSKMLQRDSALEQIEKQNLKIKLDQKLVTEEEYQAELDKISAEHAKTRADIETKYNEDSLKAMLQQRTEYVNQISDIVSNYSNIVQTLQDNELANAEGNEREQARIKKKHARASMLAQIGQIGVDTAKAIMGTWAGYASMGLPGTILAGVQTAMIAALAIAQTLKARSEMNAALKASRGLYINGRSHAQGGVNVNTPNGMIEAEGNEVIMSKAAVARYGNILSEMNSSVGGMRFPQAESKNQGGLSATINPADLKVIVSEVVAGASAIPVTVTERSISNAQSRQVSITNYAKI